MAISGLARPLSADSAAVPLRQAGVPVTCTRYDGATHGFMSMSNVAEIGKRGVEQITTALRIAFGTATVS